MVKFVVDRPSRRLLGCHIAGPSAADLLYDAVIAMRQRGTIELLAKAVGVFPTLQEGMEGSARSVLRSIPPQDARGPLVTAAAER